MPYAFITELKNVRKHSNADRLQVAECFGNQVIVSLESREGDIGVYFATDSQIGEEYAVKNDLLRRKDENGNQCGGYLDPNKRNIRALKLRGEISDGLFMPLKSLKSFTDISKLKSGDCVDVVDGILIAQKYIPKRNQPKISDSSKKSKGAKFKGVEYPLFDEHIDTSQYAYNKHVFKEGDLITITLKMHGTSGRSANTIKKEFVKPTAINNILVKLGIKKGFTESYDIVSGTRRVVLKDFEGGYHGSNEFRKKYHDDLASKLKKSESAYYEIVGFMENGTPIMPRCSNKKVSDKEFSKIYGDETTFSYGCEIGQNDMYVYRMSMTNEDGEVVEYPTWLVKQRCEEMGLKSVPVLDQFFFTTIEDLDSRVNNLYDGVDPIGKTHIREGVVIRIENRQKFSAYKHKNFYFKLLDQCRV